MVSKEPFHAARDTEFTTDGTIIIGIDPGPKHTGFCVIDGEVPIFAATITRPDDGTLPEDFAVTVATKCKQWVDDILEEHPDATIAIEGVVPPQTHMRGVKSFISPKYVLNLGLVAGAVFATFPNARRIRPGNNGSGHPTQYPPQLSGRRNHDILPGEGKGVRDHEKSAYDVARKASFRE